MKAPPTLLLLLALLSACAGQPSERCALEPVGTLPVWLVDNVPVTVVGINERPSALVLDIGSDGTLLSRAAATRLGVRFSDRQGLRLSGAGGQAKASPVVLKTVQLADAVLQNVDALVGRGLRPPFDGVLGTDVLASFELDLDARNGEMALYRARPPGCAGAPPPWAGRYARLRTEQDGSAYLFTPVVLNGQRLRAMLDTGASRTTIGLPAAAVAGITRADLRRGPTARTESLDAAGLVVQPRQFKELRIGEDVIADPVLNIARLPPLAGDMIVGQDYLGSRRVWIALAAGAVYVTTADQPRPR